MLPVSSLPSPYGIGTLGDNARRWVDFLAAAGQRYWQGLPLGPTSFGDSPYQSFSAFAGNPYFIDLDALCAQGLVRREEYEALDWGGDARSVSYELLYRNRERVLRKAFARFKDAPELAAFNKDNDFWLDNYALFMAIKQSEGGRSWVEWRDGLKMADSAELSALRESLEKDIRYHRFVQYLFFSQWRSLRAYANKKGVEIIGDIPIYVAMDSADVWADKKLCQFGPNAAPLEVAGCPPDSFTAEGQLWGNPLYDWDAMAKNGYAWWLKRMHASFELYDVLRIDHFRGLESYYAIPFGSTAVKGRWRNGPDMAFVGAVKQSLPYARVIVEDLGFHTPALREFLRESGYPGMKVLQFAFDSREPGDYSPFSYDHGDVVFTGTHDNDTVLGWAQNAPKDAVANAMAYTGVDSAEALPRAMIRLALQNQAKLSVVPLQDWLGLGSEARVNIPSTVGGRNWRWRAVQGDLTPELAGEMRQLTELYGR